MTTDAASSQWSYDDIVRRFCAMAEADDNIRAAIIIGSRARIDRPADAWSDLDLLIVARDPAVLWDSSAWCGAMGDVWLSFVEPTPDGEYERRVLYAGGWDVDYAPGSVESVERMLDEGLTPFAASLMARGYAFVVDKDGLCERMAEIEISAQQASLPRADEFRNQVSDLLFHLVWTAKKLLRGDLWSAKNCCDAYLKQKVLTLLTWHALATRPCVDTWVAGRHMSSWADPRALAELPGAFARYDADDLWRGLWSTADLARWLAQDVATAIGATYPYEADEHVREWLRSHDPRMKRS